MLPLKPLPDWRATTTTTTRNTVLRHAWSSHDSWHLSFHDASNAVLRQHRSCLWGGTCRTVRNFTGVCSRQHGGINGRTQPIRQPTALTWLTSTTSACPGCLKHSSAIISTKHRRVETPYCVTTTKTCSSCVPASASATATADSRSEHTSNRLATCCTESRRCSNRTRMPTGNTRSSTLLTHNMPSSILTTHDRYLWAKLHSSYSMRHWALPIPTATARCCPLRNAISQGAPTAYVDGACASWDQVVSEAPTERLISSTRRAT